MVVKDAHNFSGIFVTPNRNNGALKINNLVAIVIGSVFSVGAYLAMVYAFKLVDEAENKNTVKSVMYPLKVNADGKEMTEL